MVKMKMHNARAFQPLPRMSTKVVYIKIEGRNLRQRTLASCFTCKRAKRFS